MKLTDISHAGLRAWVEETAHLCMPDRIEVVEGTPSEHDAICRLLVEQGTFRKLSQAKRPNSYLALSDPADTARVEERTFICSKKAADAGPTNNWVDPEEMKTRLLPLFKGSMQGRTMYVVPYSMGPTGAPMSRIGVEITDSAYVVANMYLMTRTGSRILDVLGKDGGFVRCLHSCGKRAEGKPDPVPTWPCDPERMAIVHFPEDRAIWAYGSGYGGNALLNKKCFALRIATNIAREEGWLAEHMMVLCITNPEGKKKYFAGAFPSACGKTNLAMLESKLPGWKITTVGDDIAWMKFKDDGRLYAINPEAGFFGVAPNTSFKSNPNAMRCLDRNAIFTNCAYTPEGDIWWEGIGYPAPEGTMDWHGRFSEGKDGPMAHPNSRFTVHASTCPSIDDDWESPEGVPISAILFGGRRSATIPLVLEARDWNHGVFMGAVLSSETTAAAKGQVGRLRRDPFAMLPFCGYNIGDYFSHWLSFGGDPDRKLPRIYQVNWFRKDAEGRFLWPGYSDNMRVLKWIFERCDGEGGAEETPFGLEPKLDGFDTRGLDMPMETLQAIFAIPPEEARKETDNIRHFLLGLGNRIPAELFRQLAIIEEKAANP